MTKWIYSGDARLVQILETKQCNLLYYRVKKKSLVIRSIDAEKIFDKIQSICRVKTLSKLRIEGNFLHMIEIIYRKTVVDDISNDKKLNYFSPKSGIRQRNPSYHS